jgi:hypothetical protein
LHFLLLWQDINRAGSSVIPRKNQNWLFRIKSLKINSNH